MFLSICPHAPTALRLISGPPFHVWQKRMACQDNGDLSVPRITRRKFSCPLSTHLTLLPILASWSCSPPPISRPKERPSTVGHGCLLWIYAISEKIRVDPVPAVLGILMAKEDALRPGSSRLPHPGMSHGTMPEWEGVKFCRFMLAATQVGSKLPIRASPGASKPWLGSLPMPGSNTLVWCGGHIDSIYPFTSPIPAFSSQGFPSSLHAHLKHSVLYQAWFLPFTSFLCLAFRFLRTVARSFLYNPVG